MTTDNDCRLTLRLYEHVRARVVERDGVDIREEMHEVEAFGWNFSDGDTVEIGDETFVLMSGVGATGIHTDDNRGHYIEALAVLA